MAQGEKRVYSYIPNSAPEAREAMLKALGIEDTQTLFKDIPPELQLNRLLDLPDPILSEHDLKQHVQALLARNVNCNEVANFLGGGLYQHFIPALCDEINSRGEFLTAYAGDTYSDHGKHQAWFEFQSLLAELLEMDVVSFSTYDWATAASNILLMAGRLTGCREAIVPRNLNPERLSHMQNYCKAGLDRIVQVDFDPETGQIDLADLERKISAATAAVYFENPSYFGVIEAQGQAISQLAHDNGALCLVGVDPISLAVLTPPAQYGADIVCGDVQPLGVHMLAGTGTCGFIASHDDPATVEEYPTLLETIGPTEREGEWGFGWATLERTSYDKREQSQDFTGTAAGLWAITAAVYMATLGPQGMFEVNRAIMQKSQYAMQVLAEVGGVRVPVFNGTPFREFVVNFDGVGKTVKEINKRLLSYDIFGGKDISAEFPELGQAALMCVTEVTSLQDIHRLVDALKEVLQ